MKLTVAERFSLLGMLPQQGNYATQKVVRELVKRVEFSSKELRKMEYKQVEDKIQWDPEKEPVKDVEFGKFESEIISEALKDLDAEKKLERRHLSLYEKFVT